MAAVFCKPDELEVMDVNVVKLCSPCCGATWVLLVNVRDKRFCHDQQIEWLKRMVFVALSVVVMLPGGGQYAYGVPLRRVGSDDILTRINITGKT
jgi:hypothetical protein